jgi:hypothetical protein
MSDFPGIVPDAASRFLDSRLVCLRNASIPEKQGRWYVKRVETFIKVKNVFRSRFFRVIKSWLARISHRRSHHPDFGQDVARNPDESLRTG